MTFLAPLLLGSLLVLPLIYLAHLLRGSRRRLRVPSTAHWLDLPRELTGRSRARIPPLTLPMLLQLLAATTAALALARLATSGELPRHVALVLDASASMQAVDVAPSRFEAARAVALERLEALGAQDTVSVVRAGPRAVLLASGRPDQVRDALVQVQPGAGGGALAEALALASSQVARTPRVAGQIVLLTDGAFAALDPPGTLSAPVETVSVGGGAGNQAIVGLEIRPEPSGRSQAAYLELANEEERAVRLRVRVLADDLLVDTRSLDVAPRSIGRVVVSVPAETSRVTAALEGRDALALDDRAEVATPSLRPRQVLLVSHIPAALQRALRAIPYVRLTVVSPNNFKAAAVAADLTVLDGFMPQKAPPGPLLVVNPPVGTSLLETTVTEGAVGGPLTVFDTQHPLLQGVDAVALRSGRAAQLTIPAWARVVAATAAGPLVMEGRRDGRPIVFVTPDPILSGLEKSIAFPVLVGNAVSHLLGGGAGPSIAAGHVVSIPAVAESVVVLRRPDGRQEVLQAVGNELRVERTEEVGRYTVVEQSSGRALRTFAVNLADAAESDIRPRAAAPPRTELLAAAPETVVEWWTPLVLAALALLGVEWFVFARRG